MKKRTYAFIALLIFFAVVIIDNLRMANAAEELRKEKDNLTEQVAAFEQEREKASKIKEETKKENALLIEELSSSKKQIEDLKSQINYQDFIDAISAVESYNDAGSFNSAKEFIAFSMETGFYTRDRAGNCPCGISFGGRSIEWMPGSVLELKEFRMERERILLTYKTIEKIRRDYQFVMTKTKKIGFKNNYKDEQWGIEEIKLIVKEN